MTLEELGVFGCQDCIGGRTRGHAPVDAPTCEQLQARSLCGKQMLRDLVSEGKVEIIMSDCSEQTPTMHIYDVETGKVLG